MALPESGNEQVVQGGPVAGFDHLDSPGGAKQIKAKRTCIAFNVPQKCAKEAAKREKK